MVRTLLGAYIATSVLERFDGGGPVLGLDAVAADDIVVSFRRQRRILGWQLALYPIEDDRGTTVRSGVTCLVDSTGMYRGTKYWIMLEGTRQSAVGSRQYTCTPE